MSTLQIFVTPEELEQVLQEFVGRHGLRACRENKREYVLLDEGAPLVQEDGKVRFMIFLFPSEVWNPDSPRPRDEGWIHVTPGQLYRVGDKSILTLTTIQAENRKDLSFKPATWLRGLRKRIAATCIFGIQGRNIVYGGSDNYQDMAYSPSALELYQQGVLWKQYVNDNAEFSPL